MQDGKTNGSNPQQLQIPDGDRFLFVRMNEKGEFQILFSDLHTGIVLTRLADKWLDKQIEQGLGLNQPAQPMIATPGVAVDPQLLARLRKKGITVGS